MAKETHAPTDPVGIAAERHIRIATSACGFVAADVFHPAKSAQGRFPLDNGAPARVMIHTGESDPSHVIATVLQPGENAACG